MLNLPCRDLLVVRYPIRKKDDLLPLFSLETRESLALLMEELRQAGCGMSEPLVLDHVVGGNCVSKGLSSFIPRLPGATAGTMTSITSAWSKARQKRLVVRDRTV